MRERIDITLLEQLLRSYAELNGFEVRSLIVRGIPDDVSQSGGVKVNMLVLGPEIPQPEQIREALKRRFSEKFFTVPDDERDIPDEWKPVLYIGSVKEQYHVVDDDGDVVRRGDVHYCFKHGDVLLFNETWKLYESPRPSRVFYNTVQFWNRVNPQEDERRR